MFKKKKSPSWIILGTAILLIGGVGVVSWLLFHRRDLVGDLPLGAEILPQDALLTASISTDEAQWQQLREYGTPETRAALEQQLAIVNKNFLAANGYNYERDIKPWLGDKVTIAYLPSEEATANSTSSTPAAAQLSMVTILPIQDPLKAQQLLEKQNISQAAKDVKRTYRGVTITERASNSPSQNFSSTVLGRSLVVGNSAKATERVIDTYLGKPSLAVTPGYTQALGQIQATSPFAQLYFNVPTATAVAASTSTRSLSPENLATAQQQQGIAATVTLEPEKIRFKGISWLKPDSERKWAIANNAQTAPNRLPANTLVMMSNGNFQQLWQDYIHGAKSNPVLPIKPENVSAALKSTTGLDLEQDFLPWMQGEFSLAIIPKPQAVVSDLGVGIALIVQASDRTKASQTFDRLDEAMSQKYKLKIQKTEIAGQPVVNWTSELGGISGTHGWLDDKVAFLTLGAPIAEALVPEPETPLTENELFSKTASTDLTRNNGHFFIDMEKTINAGNLPLPLLPPKQRKLTNAIRSIGVTSAANKERSNRFDILVMMNKAQPPAATPSSSPSVTTSPSASR